MVKSRLWRLRVPGSKPDSTDDPPYFWAQYTLNVIWVKRPHVSVVLKCGDGVAISGVEIVIGPWLKMTISVPKQALSSFKMES
ncbi:hypothetical protein AVEN_44359-1 [Araneus ventricosus]|uniref:Uncharacterized protein n=1 Tax=Araneus ventricosus TaxID=182803 RepID=A0A4Y2SW02_ARAVE|nr:hypothetical protein AVEN_44359-1 [Araneus ventricosus]